MIPRRRLIDQKAIAIAMTMIIKKIRTAAIISRVLVKLAALPRLRLRMRFALVVRSGLLALSPSTA